MRQIVSKASKYLSINNEKGVTAIEYGMLAALIALAIIAAVIVLGGNLNEVFTNLGTQVKAP
ncbi:Flp family type IVb pilin [Phenylobacterium sp.]|uniref:Flp family type IVb pilin n=1 Tax=Phenylobacterium sp. TaxID=1871053 RepID=UPI003918ED11